MTRLSWVMTAGTGWLLFLLLAALVDRQRGWKATRAVVPALWFATTTVEHPIKKWFRLRGARDRNNLRLLSEQP